MRAIARGEQKAGHASASDASRKQGRQQGGELIEQCKMARTVVRWVRK